MSLHLTSRESILKELKSLDARIRSQAGKEELQEVLQSVSNQFVEMEKIKKVATDLTTHSWREQADDLVVICKESVPVRFSADLAKSSSAYIRQLCESPMNESRTRQINFHEFSPNMVRLIKTFMILGSQGLSFYEIPQLTPVEAHELLELSYRLEIPWLIKYIAEKIEKFCELDATHYALAESHIASGLAEYLPSWKMIREKVVRKIAPFIETAFQAETFSTSVPISGLETLIRAIPEEPWKPLCAANPGTYSIAAHGFTVKLNKQRLSQKTNVNIQAVDHAGLLDENFSGSLKLFKARLKIGVEAVRDVEGRRPSLEVVLETADVCKDYTWEDIFQYRAELPGFYNTQSDCYKISCAVSMTRLQRQCFALVQYACPTRSAGQGNDSRAKESRLIKALMFFHEKRNTYCVSLLMEYASQCFTLIKDRCNLILLPLDVIENFIKQDDLITHKHEEYVLQLVVRVAMSSHTADQTFQRLVKYVRFPYIERRKLDSVLTEEETKFAKSHPIYKNLLYEAACVQQKAASKSKKEGQQSTDAEASRRAAKRKRYEDVPELDLKYLVCK